MILVPKKDLGQYLRIKKKKENRFPVVRKSGARIGIYTLSVLNPMWGHGWFLGAARNGVLRLLVLRVPVGQFYWGLERITGEVRPTRAEERRYSWWLFYKYCACCGREKHRDDFSPVPFRSADSLGDGSFCESGVAEERRRAATTNQEIRRSRETYAGGAHSEDQWRELLNRCGARCLRCGAQTDLTRDHVVPLSRGGNHDISNIQPLCRRCNSWKNDRIIDFRDHPILQAPALP